MIWEFARAWIRGFARSVLCGWSSRPLFFFFDFARACRLARLLFIHSFLFLFSFFVFLRFSYAVWGRRGPRAYAPFFGRSILLGTRRRHVRSHSFLFFWLAYDRATSSSVSLGAKEGEGAHVGMLLHLISHSLFFPPSILFFGATFLSFRFMGPLLFFFYLTVFTLPYLTSLFSTSTSTFFLPGCETDDGLCYTVGCYFVLFVCTLACTLLYLIYLSLLFDYLCTIHSFTYSLTHSHSFWTTMR